jgi:hypothetical protein
MNVMKADFVAYDRNGQIVLIAEVKNKKNVSSEWATKLRRNILAHGDMPNAEFFMIALPERFYLWKNAGNKPELKAPTLEIEANSLLKPYFEKTGISIDNMTPQSFEFIISAWLNSILQDKISSEEKKESKNWLNESGFSKALSGGYLKYEVAL